MQEYVAEVFSEERYELGESPFYDPRTGTLSWVDIIPGTFYTLGADGKGAESRYDFGQAIGAAVPAEKPGSYAVAGTDGIYLYADGRAQPVTGLDAYYEPYQRSNDAKADPAGRLWFGSSVADGYTAEHEACGNLFCLDGGTVTCRQAGTKISNGMAWSSDRTKFFFSDSLCHAVFSYDYDLKSGSITNRRVLFPVEDGVPDGMCIDSEDCLWVAVWGGSRIERRSTKDGSLLARIKVDAAHVTSCCFTGSGEPGRLFITSSARGLSGKHDGCLFTCTVNAKSAGTDFARL